MDTATSPPPPPPSLLERLGLHRRIAVESNRQTYLRLVKRDFPPMTDAEISQLAATMVSAGITESQLHDDRRLIARQRIDAPLALARAEENEARLSSAKVEHEALARQLEPLLKRNAELAQQIDDGQSNRRFFDRENEQFDNERRMHPELFDGER